MNPPPVTPPPASPEETLLRLLCEPAPDPAAVTVAATALTGRVGALLERAITAKVLCLLAHQFGVLPGADITGGVLAGGLTRPVRRFLAAALRASHHKAVVHRAEAARVFAALADVGIAAVAVHGLAVESTLYGGTGARQFSDVDILLAPDDLAPARAALTGLGYRGAAADATTCRRPLDDVVVPRVTVDLAPAPHLDSRTITAVLCRRTEQPLPGHDHPLPVLADPEALLLSLARLGHHGRRRSRPALHVEADVLRYLRHLPEPPHQVPGGLFGPVHEGWQLMRRTWPHLTAGPGPLGTGTAARTGARR